MKKLFTVLLVLLMLSGCGMIKNKPEDKKEDTFVIDGKTINVNDYYDELMHYEAKPRNISNTKNNEKFDEFLDEVFRDFLAFDFLNMHYSVIDYKKYGIEKPEVTIGTIEYGLDEEGLAYNYEIIEKLRSFDYDSLSYSQQLEYQNLEYSMLETICDQIYYQYEFIFNSTDNVLENVISNLTDYTFYDKESVDDYLLLVDDFDNYFTSALKFTADQAADGHPMIDEWIDYTQEYTQRATSSSDENNELIVSFDTRINALDFLSEEEKSEYCARNKEMVIRDVIPMIRKIGEDVEQYRGKADSEDYLPYKLSKEFANVKYTLYTSSNEGVDKILDDLVDSLSYLEAELSDIYYNEDYYNEFLEAVNDMGHPEFNYSLEEMLEFLKENITDYFPDIGEANYTIDYINAETAPEGVIAYYYPSPIDNLDQNIIRFNPNASGERYGIFGTIAHEGIPGHLYQNLYFYKTDPYLYRATIGYTGYSEAWAVYSTYYAYKTLGMSDPASAAIYYMDCYYFFEYSIIDILTNYYGYSANKIYKYFADNFMLERSSSYLASIRSWIIENPYQYCCYGAAALMFKLRDKAMNALGDKFDLVEFNDTIIKNGPLPYVLLEAEVDRYIADNQ